jgi:leader peptidase (prepilin peptidase)/N-methyltransferase
MTRTDGVLPRRRDIAGTAAVALAAITAVAASVLAVPGRHGALGAALAVMMLAIAAIDLRAFIIPDELTAAAFALGLLNAAAQIDGGWQGAGLAVLRAAVLAGSFLAVRAAYSRLRGRIGIGLGDVKLAGAAGAWLEWTTMPIAVEIAALAALAVYLARQMGGGRPIRATARLPFGLFLAPAIWLCWLLQETLLAG